MQDGDEEHIPHHLFTELDELSFSDGQLQEWKETARLGQILRTPRFTLLSLLPTQFLYRVQSSSSKCSGILKDYHPCDSSFFHFPGELKLV